MRTMYYTQANLTGNGAYTLNEIKKQLINHFGWNPKGKFTAHRDVAGVLISQPIEPSLG